MNDDQRRRRKDIKKSWTNIKEKMRNYGTD